MPQEPDSGPDLKRLGIFKELGYTTINDPYSNPLSGSISRGKQIPGLKPFIAAGGYSKLRSASDDGYFGHFERIYTGEAYTNINLLRRSWRIQSERMKIGNHWMPSNGSKHRSGIGSPSGCFQENIPAMSRDAKITPYVPQLHNFYTNPGKKGTGYGYLDITIDPYPPWMPGAVTFAAIHAANLRANQEHKGRCLNRPEFINQQHSGEYFDPTLPNAKDPLAPGGPSDVKMGVAAYPKSMMIGPNFIPSSPAKWDGGCKDGALSKWPEYSSEPYIEQYKLMMAKYRKKPGDEALRAWVPQPPTADTIPTPSIINKKVDIAINNKTRKKKLYVTPMCKK